MISKLSVYLFSYNHHEYSYYFCSALTFEKSAYWRKRFRTRTSKASRLRRSASSSTITITPVKKESIGTLSLTKASRASLYFSSFMSPGTTSSAAHAADRKSTRLNSSHGYISYAVFCLKKKNQTEFYPI